MSEEKRQPKTKEELEELKKEVEDLCKKLAELTEEERKEIGVYLPDPNELTDEQMAQVSGGRPVGVLPIIFATGALLVGIAGQSDG